jgi:enoyl reductase
VAIGEAVYALVPFDRDGAAAEYVAVSARDLATKPRSLSFTQAAATPLAALTAWQALMTHAHVRAYQRVLIHDAAGAVGIFAVQIARLRGAHVIGTASRENHDYLRALGAEPVLYGPDLAQRVRTLAPHGVHAALDGSGRGALDASIELGIDPSRIGTLVDFEDVQRLGVQAVRSQRSRERLQALVDLHDAGLLRVHVRDIYPLAYAAVAHRDVENGHGRGKVVLMVYETKGFAL